MNFSPCRSGVTRMRAEIQRTTGFEAMSAGLSPANSILTPVATRNAAKIHSTQYACSTSAAPTPIITPRSKITAMMPHSSARYWYIRGIAK